MLRSCLFTLIVSAVCVAPAAAQLRGLDDPDPKLAKIRKLAAALDRSLESTWKEQGVIPAATADDGEYLRRVTLDLIGRTPRVAEARDFLADANPDKRAAIVAKLLQTPAHAQHSASLTRGDWFNLGMDDFRRFAAANSMEIWLRREYAANTPQDELVRKLLTAKVAVGQRGRAFERSEDEETPFLAAFYQANDGKPETIAATVSRTFLGIKLECAQCHDHPFAPYTRDQFWQFAAFFGEFTALSPISPSFVGPLYPQSDLNQIDIPNTPRTVTAQFLDGTEPEWSRDATPRQELADWLLAPRNAYFAKNMANRLWAQLIGIGIIDPIDEPGSDNLPSHPELLDLLAQGYAQLGFDRHALIRAIAMTRAYQLSSKQTDPSQADPRKIARANLRGLTGHQVYDSFLAATGRRDTSLRNEDFFSRNASQGRLQFTVMFGSLLPKPTESRTSILQSLMLMNGKQVSEQTDPKTATTLGAVIDAPFLTDEQRLETLFLAAYTRLPTTGEQQKYLSLIDRAGTKPADRAQALADVFWVLLNSPEFAVNH